MAIFDTKKEKKTAKARHARASKRGTKAAHDIVRAPWFSEKALIATEKGVYTFAVPPRATKADIAGAIKQVYNVEPRLVRVVNLPAKRKPMRTKHGMGTRAARTKAYVYLNEGDTITFA
ncbi:50S ribosomal protein L23 [Candidatus Kaiserbacteria bacterium CG10_big_fil_rev_8_21_14_0_10_56_12]|uniref:Large ribosomal subunit protein uL23 n=1 Tax=Candidatus Kaiserbacteria bacterium CG10_big_fil_rev_8_21_14_0_10_56_12 TaxID=1974611 RepID=A0A2H0U9E6_9BACT|nr:MAG: 50S ribosomal protein L23 [Candidatus Kaiserbacteria bacterium CG10_big_fil_rev_8_21_14_0_10_56_12]